jgi:hypothetical protein
MVRIGGDGRRRSGTSVADPSEASRLVGVTRLGPGGDGTAARGVAKSPGGRSKRVGMVVEIPDFAAFQEFMQTDPAAEAMKHDGVHADTLVILAEG